MYFCAEQRHHFFIDVLFSLQYKLEGVFGSNRLKNLVEGDFKALASIVLLCSHNLIPSTHTHMRTLYKLYSVPYELILQPLYGGNADIGKL